MEERSASPSTCSCYFAIWYVLTSEEDDQIAMRIYCRRFESPLTLARSLAVSSHALLPACLIDQTVLPRSFLPMRHSRAPPARVRPLLVGGRADDNVNTAESARVMQSIIGPNRRRKVSPSFSNEAHHDWTGVKVFASSLNAVRHFVPSILCSSFLAFVC